MPSIQAEVDAFTSTHQIASCVGLHVRRTDHLSTAGGRGGVTSDEEFVAAIRERLALEPRQRFYLATDNAATQRWLRDLFGQSICYWREISPEAALAPALDGVDEHAHTEQHSGAGEGGVVGGRRSVDQPGRSEKAKRPPPHRHTSMAHAVIDLWLLSRCGAIVGSNASSYTDFAKWLRGPPT